MGRARRTVKGVTPANKGEGQSTPTLAAGGAAADDQKTAISCDQLLDVVGATNVAENVGDAMRKLVVPSALHSFEVMSVACVCVFGCVTEPTALVGERLWRVWI